jgi:hypothetical protein
MSDVVINSYQSVPVDKLRESFVQVVADETMAADEYEYVTGQGLSIDDCVTPDMVADGKRKEYESIVQHDVFEEVVIPKGVRPIGTRWVLRRKHDCCKARLVVQQIAREQSSDYFAPTPNLTSLRLAVAHSAWQRIKYGQSQTLVTADVGTAFLNALLSQDVFVQPPKDIGCKPGHCWKLRRALYGLRCAPKA